jgi:muramoyltetrapeptide carboxypeptidase
MCIDPSEDCLVEPAPEYADDLYFLREDSDHRIKQKNEGIKVFKDGIAEGEIVVGNLQTLLLLNGTEYLPNMKDKLLFIEEDETSTVAHVDRFLTQCKQLGWFGKIRGLAFGRFTAYSGFTSDDPLESLLKQQFEDAKFPILYNVDFGHSDPLITIPNGGIATIDAGKKRIILKRAVE